MNDCRADFPGARVPRLFLYLFLLNNASNESKKLIGQHAGRTSSGSRVRRTLSLLVVCLLLLTGMILPTAAAADGGDELTRIVDTVNSKNEKDKSFRFAKGAETLKIVFPRIRECDACLVTDGKESIVIDCATAEQAPQLLSMLEKQGITELDAVYITHPHPDHAGGLELLFQHLRVGEVWTCFDDTATATAKNMADLCRQYDVPLKRYAHGHTFQVGKADFKTYVADDKTFNENNRSAAYRMQYGRAVMFFAADLERYGLRWMGENIPYQELRMDIIKYPHHGKDPLVKEFWRPAQLRFAVVTSDTTPRNGKQDIRDKRWPAAFTWNGEITLETDGETWLITQDWYQYK